MDHSGGADQWAGYPFITWVEIRAGEDGAKGQLKLNAEVGPISDPEIRKRMIDSIKAMASEKGLGRIQFQTGATDQGRLYSRFLRKNTVAVNDIHDVDEIERKLLQLLGDFNPEFGAVTSVISQFFDPTRIQEARRAWDVAQ